MSVELRRYEERIVEEVQKDERGFVELGSRMRRHVEYEQNGMWFD